MLKKQLISSAFLVLTVSLVSMALFSFKESNSPNAITVNVLYDTSAYVNNKDTINYQKGKLLTWADFQGAVPGSNIGNSVANSSVGYSYNASLRTTGNKTTITIKICSFFIRNKSWALTRQKNAYILNHEQHHFDIARYAAELFKQQIRKATINRSNFNAVINSIYQKSWETYQKLQSQYDKETNHSIQKTQQANWDKKMNDLIKAIQ